MIFFIFEFILSCQNNASNNSKEKSMNITETKCTCQYISNVRNQMNSELKRKTDVLGDENKYISKKNKNSHYHGNFTSSEQNNEVSRLLSHDLTIPDGRFKLSKFKIYSYYQKQKSIKSLNKSFDHSSVATPHLGKKFHNVSTQKTDKLQEISTPSCSYLNADSFENKINDVESKKINVEPRRMDVKTVSCDFKMSNKIIKNKGILFSEEKTSKYNNILSQVMLSLRYMKKQLETLSKSKINSENVLTLLFVIFPHLETQNSRILQNTFESYIKSYQGSNLKTNKEYSLLTINSSYDVATLHQNRIGQFETEINQKITQIRSAEYISDKEIYSFLEFSHLIVEYEKNRQKDIAKINENDFYRHSNLENPLEAIKQLPESFIMSEIAFLMAYHSKIQIRQNHVLYVRYIVELLKKYIKQIAKHIIVATFDDYNSIHYIFKCRCIIFMLLHGFEGFSSKKYIYFALSNLILHKEIGGSSKIFFKCSYYSFLLNIILNTSFSSVYTIEEMLKIEQIYVLLENFNTGKRKIIQNLLFDEFRCSFICVDTIKNTIEVYKNYRKQIFLPDKTTLCKYIEDHVLPKYENSVYNGKIHANEIISDLFKISFFIEKQRAKAIYFHWKSVSCYYKSSIPKAYRTIESNLRTLLNREEKI